MKRLPVYVMTAAIAMTGLTSITSLASAKAVVIGSGGVKTYDLNLGQLAGNSFPGISLPDCDSILPGGGGFPNIDVIPNQNRPTMPNQGGNHYPEIGVPDSGAPEIGYPEIGVPDQPSENESDSSFVSQVAALVNEERAKAGLSPLTIDTQVAAAASVRAREIESSFSHTRPDGSNFSTALTQNGVSFRSSGENIAYGQRTPQEVMNGWMNSQGHRANILNKDFTAIGVGYHQNSAGTGYWTQLFTR